jgi:phosphate transport system substrate-binding protein
MSYIRTIILFLVLLNLTYCKNLNRGKVQENLQVENKSSLSGNISISGAYALYPLVHKWADDFMKIHPAVKIEVTTGGTGQGIADLYSKKNKLAMISRPLTDEEMTEGIWVVPVAKEGVAPIINQRNPYLGNIMKHGITPEKLIRLFTGEMPMTWGELLDTISSEKVVVYNRSDESGAADVWANFLWKERNDLKGIKVTGDSEMIKSIQGNTLGIGFCNFAYAFDPSTGERIKDVQVIPIDLDFDRTIDRKEVPFANIKRVHRGIWLGYYPKNLTRELVFGSIGKPTDHVIKEFLKYVLTVGQSDVASTGMCELNDVYIEYALNSL